ncbi:MAG: four helix bundle protein [Chitinophagales bacterium]|nr:four helix bundle protein [Chitinophagales bacterium]
MATVSRFEDLDIWKMAREQAMAIFEITRMGLFSADFELRKQINAAAGSVMDNIAEGFERFSNKEFTQFLVIAKGSNGEVRSQLYRANDRHYISDEMLKNLLEFSELLGRKIKSFLDYLSSSPFKSKPRNKT